MNKGDGDTPWELWTKITWLSRKARRILILLVDFILELEQKARR